MCCCKTIVQLLLTIYGAKSQLSSTKASCSQCSSITQVFIVCWSRGSKSNSISLNSVFPTLIHSKLSSSHPKVEFMLRVDNWTTQLNRAKLLWRLLFEFQAHLFAIEKEECAVVWGRQGNCWVEFWMIGSFEQATWGSYLVDSCWWFFFKAAIGVCWSFYPCFANLMRELFRTNHDDLK